MKDLIDKIGSYNIFNFLLPGVVFAVFVSEITSFKLIQEDALAGAFMYYFFGSIISRIGSLVIEPILKVTKFIIFVPYEDFIIASKKDSKLEVLSETNNMYRTICALLLCVGVTYLYDITRQFISILNEYTPGICIFILFILFILSYKKQTLYITKRITTTLKQEAK